MISVVLTTYKRKIDVLKKSIESVLEQSYKNFELIIVNDNPDNDAINDYLLDFCKVHDNVIYIHVSENGGACIARNRGAELAKGEYIAFLDDDDVWCHCKLEKQRECIQKSDEIVLVTGYIKYNDLFVCNKEDMRNGWIFEFLLGHNFIGGTSAPLIRKDAFKRVGGFDKKYPSSQDYNLWLKLSKIGKVEFVDEIILYYYVSEDSITKDMAKRIEGWKYILSDFKNDYLAYPAYYLEFLRVISDELVLVERKKRLFVLKHLIYLAFKSGINKRWLGTVKRIVFLRKGD